MKHWLEYADLVNYLADAVVDSIKQEKRKQISN
ncbi:hypothetical protein SAMN05428964_11134 [Thalassospira xiamenensis]|uniref:Uncharacterized protein n=1 Tax=Thalassospira xiamenensis TaxID=220697 RepID=A0A285TYK2_9PROT|nr:hypothetical protein SAMN05428964_11134 [Thalassospira xiamenensis]